MFAAESIREANYSQHENGLLYSRKATSSAGMEMKINNLWESNQLFPHLQEIIKNHQKRCEKKVEFQQ